MFVKAKVPCLSTTIISSDPFSGTQEAKFCGLMRNRHASLIWRYRDPLTIGCNISKKTTEGEMKILIFELRLMSNNQHPTTEEWCEVCTPF